MLPVIFGAMAAIICALLWAGIVVVTGYEVGIVAWLVGLGSGIAVAMTTSERSVRLGTIAAGAALVGILVGKIIIVQWSVPGAADELAEMMDEEDASEIPARLEPKVEELRSHVIERMSSMSLEEKKELCRGRLETLVAEASFTDHVKSQMSFYDILWFLFAVASAWRIATGGTGTD